MGGTKLAHARSRHGTGVFEVGGDRDRERSMPVLVRFADGT